MKIKREKVGSWEWVDMREKTKEGTSEREGER